MPTPPPPKEHQFKPGYDPRRNLGGRPKGRSVTARLRDLLERGEINGKPVKDGKQIADLVAEVILKEALKGNHRFMSMLLERTEGKAPDRAPDGGQAPRISIPEADDRWDGRDESPGPAPGGGEGAGELDPG